MTKHEFVIIRTKIYSGLIALVVVSLLWKPSIYELIIILPIFSLYLFWLIKRKIKKLRASLKEDSKNL